MMKKFRCLLIGVLLASCLTSCNNQTKEYNNVSWDIDTSNAHLLVQYNANYNQTTQKFDTHYEWNIVHTKYDIVYKKRYNTSLENTFIDYANDYFLLVVYSNNL